MFYYVLRRIRIKEMEKVFPIYLCDRVEIVFQSNSLELVRKYYENMETDTKEWYLITSHIFETSNYNKFQKD